MKKSIILISIILSSCANEINCEQIKFINGISYYNGKIFNGPCTSRFLSGGIKSRQLYLNGKDNGAWIFYYSNGSKKTEAFFNYGKRNGEWNFYSKKNILWKVQKYDSLGLPEGKWETYDTLNGELISKIDSKEILIN